MDLATLPTPCLLVELARLRRNCERMRAFAVSQGVVLRPHAKTHKCTEIALLQHGGEHGPLTVSTLAEAEHFAAAGFADLTYAVPIEPGKLARALALARRVRLQLLTDELAMVEVLDRAALEAEVRLRVLIEIDCGDHRCGVDPDGEEVMAIARRIAAAPRLDFAGILTHAGHAYGGTSDAAVRGVAEEERDRAVACAARLREAGLAVATVSIGSTPTMTHVGELSGVTEIRPGNYAFFDAFQLAHGSCAAEDCALTVLAAVVSRDLRGNRLVVDAGAIALSKDQGPRDVDPDAGFGRVLRLDGSDLGARVAAVSQEHGEIPLLAGLSAADFGVGTRLRILANHSCLTAAQHAGYHLLEDGRVVGWWAMAKSW